MRRHERPPQFPIAAILRELGFDDVPDVQHGYKKVLCAFHGERNPSASVSKFGFVCWACGRKGDAISLIREEEGLSFEAAVARCAALTGTANREVSQSGWGSRSLLDITGD
jgi:DNA primase